MIELAVRVVHTIGKRGGPGDHTYTLPSSK